MAWRHVMTSPLRALMSRLLGRWTALRLIEPAPDALGLEPSLPVLYVLPGQAMSDAWLLDALARPPHGPLPGADRAAPGQPEPGGAAGAGERLLGARPGEALRLLAPGGRRQLAADRTAAPRPLGAGQPRQRGGALRDPAAPRRAARRAGARGRPGQPHGGTAAAGPLPTGTHPGAGARPLPPSHPDRGGSQESRGARGDRGAGRRGAPLGTAPAAPGAALRPRDRLQHDLPGAALHGRPAAPALEPALRRRRRAWPGAGQGPGRRPYPGLRALPPQPHRLPAALLRALPGRPDAAAYRRRAQPRHAAGRPAAAPRRRLLPAPQLPGQPPLRHGVQRVPPPPDRPWPPPGVFHRGGPLAQRAHAAGAARHARHDPPLLPAQQRRRPPPAPGLHSGAYRLRADHRERQLPARAARRPQAPGEPPGPAPGARPAAPALRPGHGQRGRAAAAGRLPGWRTGPGVASGARDSPGMAGRPGPPPGGYPVPPHQCRGGAQPGEPGGPGPAGHPPPRHRAAPAGAPAGAACRAP